MPARAHRQLRASRCARRSARATESSPPSPRPCSSRATARPAARGRSPTPSARPSKRRRLGSRAMVVPELPADIRALKEAVGAFVEAEVYPLEERIAARGSIDWDEIDELRRKARAAGFSMLNMPEEVGGRDLSMLGQVALEEESGKATNGLGFAVVDRGPRELYEIATQEQNERYVMPVLRGEYREAWALTEPGAGSDLSGLQATAVRDGDEWVLNGEKWFVTSEGAAGRLHRPRGRQERAASRRSSSSIPDARARDPAHAGVPPRPVPRPPPGDRLLGLPRAGGEPRARERRRGREGVDPRRAAVHRGALLRRGAAARRPDRRAGRRSARRSARRSPSTRASRSRSPTRSPSCTRRG